MKKLYLNWSIILFVIGLIVLIAGAIIGFSVYPFAATGEFWGHSQFSIWVQQFFRSGALLLMSPSLIFFGGALFISKKTRH